MKAFLCHTSQDSTFVIEVAKHLNRNLDGVFYFEDYQVADEAFSRTINKEVRECQIMVIFVGQNFTKWQIKEVRAAHRIHQAGNKRCFFIILLRDAQGNRVEFPLEISRLKGFPILQPDTLDSEGALRAAAEIIHRLKIPWNSADDLPLDPHIFSYEKDIFKFFTRKDQLGKSLFTRKKHSSREKKEFEEIRVKMLNGCPPTWPGVVKWQRNPQIANRLDQSSVGKWRPEEASVLTAALIKNSMATDGNLEAQIQAKLSFPEAGPRETLYFPRAYNPLRAAVLVSGGIAPGINAVIDGIVQRHWLYAKQHGYEPGLRVYGLKNGFQAFYHNLYESVYYLAADSTQFATRHRRLETSNHVNEGGSILGTSRVDDLINVTRRSSALRQVDKELLSWDIDILYIIGGDGSMKAAHAIWSTAQENPDRKKEQRPLSVVAIPKTMDNDILWVWQSFGFLSAVEKAREIIENLNTEVTSNPRLCVAQLFGSDSGFVVSHAVLASATGHCCLALIPEIRFSMKRIAEYLKQKLSGDRGRIPSGLVVMAETAIPVDAMNYVGMPGAKPSIDIGLSEDEKHEIRKFDAMRERNERIQGQTNDALRTAGLKIVSRGLQELLPNIEIPTEGHVSSDWSLLRVFTNEPRHLLRAIRPSCSDVIIGHRLGTLAVDNAMAGYTDFMISQWLTEYVLVPLKLVVLGRKRIPTSGIFWKSVLAKTGQPADLE